MSIRTKSFLSDLGKRLKIVRDEHRYNRLEMAGKLEISRANYYKNECGISLPKVDTLYRLYNDFDISMDWFLFGGQPMHNKDKQPTPVAEKKTGGLENELPDARELLDAMEHDPMLRHEVLLNFYKYKSNKTSPAASPHDVPPLP
ncbi:MAG TPA: helix-turn-helix transcriptional regulator [Candidatus Deferrimicrobium sp.]|nr:helix-turn-helix transcriptional regulator [Candidatus Deferrimicrobium sp.]